MKILLIQPPVRDFYFTKKRSIPYGLLTIASSLKNEGFSVELLDCLATKKVRTCQLPPNSEFLNEFYGREDLSSFSLFHEFKHFGYSFDHIKEVIRRSDADIFAISSLFTAYSSEALKIAQIVKEVHEDRITVLGGHHPTALPLDVLKDKNVDFIIRGEGEYVLPELIKAIEKGNDHSKIQGIGYLDDGKFIVNEPAELKETHPFPVPDLSLLNHKFYSRAKKGSIVIVSSRGCPMKCTYCCVSRENSTYRRRDINSVIEEIRSAVDNGARFIDFEDENISLNRSWFLQLLKGLRDEFSNLDMEYRAMNGLFPPTLKPEIIKSMKETGFKTLNLSLGSTSKVTLRLFGRPDIKESLISVIKTAWDNCLDTVTYIITGAPSQNPYETIDDLLFLSELETLIGVSTFYPAPGSKIFDDLYKTDKIPSDYNHFRSSFMPVSDRKKRIETATIQRLGRIINFMKSRRKNNYDLSETDEFIVSEFLKDGKIKGVDKSGEFYNHLISEELTKYFLERFNPDKLKA